MAKIGFDSARNTPGGKRQHRYAVYVHKFAFDVTNAYMKAFFMLKNQYDIDNFELGCCPVFARNRGIAMAYAGSCGLLRRRSRKTP